MFGHDDHDHDENNKPQDEHQHDAGDQPAEEVVKPDAPNDDGWQHPGPPPVDEDEGNGDDGSEDSSEDHAGDHPPAPFSLGNDDSKDDSEDDKDEHADTGDSSNELIDLKQEALGKLSPLVGHLEQSPDEKFRTLMMMIQASDNQDLVREAYETALKIDNEKERAQALLDIVNEINYFTQHSKSE